MRVYRYDAAVYGEGGIHLHGDSVEVVDRPERADVLLCPNITFSLAQDQMAWDRFWNEPEVLRRPECVVTYDCSDNFDPPPLPGACYLRCGLTTTQLAQYPSAVSWPWPVPDLGPWAAQYPNDPTKVVQFVGWRTPMAETTVAVDSVRKALPHHSTLVVHDDFHGHRHRRAGTHAVDDGDPTIDNETRFREEQYRTEMFDAWFALSPQSIDGVFRYRFFEAMTAARIPVHVGQHYVLPWAHKIPWEEIAVFVPSLLANETGERVRALYAKWGPDGCRQRAGRGQAFWDTWLNKQHFGTLMTQAVEEHLAQC